MRRVALLRVMSHIWMRHVVRVNESRHRCECVLPHIWQTSARITCIVADRCWWMFLDVDSSINMPDSWPAVSDSWHRQTHDTRHCRKDSWRGHRGSLLETTREAVTLLYTCVHTWTQYMWQPNKYLSVCIWFQNWAHLGPNLICPQPRPFTLQLFLDFCANFFPEWPLNFFGHQDSPSNLAESRYPPHDTDSW